MGVSQWNGARSSGPSFAWAHPRNSLAPSRRAVQMAPPLVRIRAPGICPCLSRDILGMLGAEMVVPGANSHERVARDDGVGPWGVPGIRANGSEGLKKRDGGVVKRDVRACRRAFVSLDAQPL